MRILDINQVYKGMPVYYRHYSLVGQEYAIAHGIVVLVKHSSQTFNVIWSDGGEDTFWQGQDLEDNELYASVAK